MTENCQPDRHPDGTPCEAIARLCPWRHADDEATAAAKEILRAIPLLTVRLPHNMALRNCRPIRRSGVGVWIDAARWQGETVDLEILRQQDGRYELTVFGVRHAKPWIIEHHEDLALAELGEVLGR